MPDLFGLDIAGMINDYMGEGLLPLTLTKVVKSLDSGSTTMTTTSTTSYSGRGFIEAFKDIELLARDNTVQASDRRVVVLGASLPGGVVPNKGDQITIEGKTYYLVDILKRDPAAATYECHCRS